MHGIVEMPEFRAIRVPGVDPDTRGCKAEIREVDGVLRCNDGDLVESRTAPVEPSGGRLEILRWTGIRSMPLFAAA